MSNATPGDIVNVASLGIIPSSAVDGSGPGPGPAPVADPSKEYLPKPRAAGSRSEGRARDVLEAEKQRRYKAYADSLLGSAGTPAPIGAPSSIGGNEGGE